MIIGLGIGIPFIRNYVSSVYKEFSPLDLFTTGVNGAWYDPSDTTTLFQDAAGTTPVTAVEQPVGLMLDKRDTAYSTYFDGAGDYLSTPDSTALNLSSGDFTIECWIYPQRSGTKVLNKGGVNGTYYPDYELNYTSSGTIAFGFGGSHTVFQNSTGTTVVSQSTWTHIAIVRSGNSIKSYINGVVDINTTYSLTAVNNARNLNVGYQPTDPSSNNWLGYISNLRIVKGTALYTANFTPPTAPLTPVAGTSLLTCGTTWSGNPAITNNGNTRADKLNPFKTGTGNHAVNNSGNSANFPVLSSRYNLLTKSEQFDDAAWGKVNATVATTGYTDPLGGNTARLMVTGSTASTNKQCLQSYTPVSGVSYKASVFVKDAASSYRNFLLSINQTGSSSFINLIYSLDTGVITTSSSGAGLSLVATSKSTANNGFTTLFLQFTVVSAGSIDVVCQASYAQALAGSYYIWGADLRVANDALNQPAYQRVNTASDYDTTGFNKYLWFNGTNQWLQTNSIDFTNTAQMFVSAGVRKLSDGLYQCIAELSANFSVNTGVFNLFAQGNTDGDYSFGSKGTSIAGASKTGFVSPITNVLSGIGNISGDQAILRINGSQAAISTADQGTGNYGNYPLFVGARAGTSLWFNGRLHQLVVAGKQASAAEITSTETYINQKTGAY